MLATMMSQSSRLFQKVTFYLIALSITIRIEYTPLKPCICRHPHFLPVKAKCRSIKTLAPNFLISPDIAITSIGNSCYPAVRKVVWHHIAAQVPITRRSLCATFITHFIHRIWVPISIFAGTVIPPYHITSYTNVRRWPIFILRI